MNAPSDARPVPGFEVLAWSGDHVRVSDEARAQRVRLARLTDEDAVIVYATRAGRKDVLYSRHLRGAFTRWPPEIGPAVEHQSGEFYNSTSALMAWPDGSFAVRTHAGTIVATVGTPGATWSFRGYACFEPAPLEGMFLFAQEEGQTRLIHRSRRTEDAHVTPCGLAPPSTHHVVTELGTLLLAKLEKDGSCQLHVATREGVRDGAKLRGPENAMGYLIARRGGGAFVVLAALRGPISVQRIDEDGEPVGPRLEYESQGMLYAACAWNEGFALQLRSMEQSAIVSDGVGATTAHAGLALGRDEMPIGREGAVIASPDGSVVLFGYERMAGATLGRLIAGGADVLERVQAPTCAVETTPIATPVPLRRPAQPAAPVAPKFATRDELVWRLRCAGIAGLLMNLGDGYSEAQLTGDADAGSFREDDGQGNHCFVMWDVTGLVALGFDHESAESEWKLPRDLRDPGKHLK
ncbi:MAG: hypothetical protein JNK04_15555, partial [Myxococcales bacterium]|nr:hypothetical protein [Myxococcales bacterium]